MFKKTLKLLKGKTWPAELRVQIPVKFKEGLSKRFDPANAVKMVKCFILMSLAYCAGHITQIIVKDALSQNSEMTAMQVVITYRNIRSFIYSTLSKLLRKE
jgi:hypothetical protein